MASLHAGNFSDRSVPADAERLVEEEAKEFTQHKLNSAEIAKFDRLSQMTAKLQTAVKAEASAMKVSPGRIIVPPALHAAK